MLIIEKLKFDDVDKLSSLTSSITSNIALMAEKTDLQFGEEYILSKYFLPKPVKISLKLYGESLDEVRNRVDDKNSPQFVAKNLVGVVGFISLLIEGDRAKIKWLIVSDSYSDGEVNTLLVRRAISYCRFHGVKSIFVDVWSRNFHEYSFYRTMGFEVDKIMNVNPKRRFSTDFKLRLVLRLD